MLAKIIVLCALVGLSLSRPDSPPPYGYQPEPQPQGPAQYDFNWAVKDDYSGNDFGQQETRDGYDTKGSYYVLLPDGRRQIVNYYVSGDSGYIADVTYEGEAVYQEPQSYQPEQQQYQPRQQQYQPEQQQYQPQQQQY